MVHHQEALRSLPGLGEAIQLHQGRDSDLVLPVRESKEQVESLGHQGHRVEGLGS